MGSAITADNCGIASTINDAPAVFLLGATTVTWTVTDNAGLTATATQTLTVTDTENPTITAPANVTVNSDAGSCEATGVALGSPITADNCGIASVTNDSSEPFALGTTTVTWTATDKAGNIAEAKQDVIVKSDQITVIDAFTTDEANQKTLNY